MSSIVISHSQEKCSEYSYRKELVMQALVSLRFSNGDFQHGFKKNVLSAIVTDSQNSIELEIQLPPAPLIPGLYQGWQNTYSSLVETRVRKVLPEELVVTSFSTENLARGFSKKQPTNFSFYECQQECNQYAQDLRTQINQWLTAIKSQLKAGFDLDANSEILLTINTESITSSLTKDILHRLPWQEWDYFNHSWKTEAVLCLSESDSNSPEIVDDGIFRRVRITSIFGDSTNIDVAVDKELIAKLQKRGAELINLEQPQRQDFIKLWDEPCDILFYSGHSESSIDGTVGSLQINSEESLNLQEIRNTFQEAIRKGLKLAIFNSCDGLGLAFQLAKLHLPYIIVWREPVPDKIAQTFLEYFLSSYAEGKSLFTSVRDARIKLVELTGNDEKENQIPGLKWLPIICKNTSYAPPTWEDLGGLTGKLPECPYQGLSAFGEEDKDFFFGRDDAITDLVGAVNNNPLIPIIGASGSGKSSVVFAGLIPQLRNVGNVQIVSFRPGKNPFDALAVALSQIQRVESSNHRLEELELGVHLQNSEQVLCKFIEGIIQHRQNSTTNNIYSSERFVLIADQFEELYTLTDDSLRQSFLDLLLYAVQYAPLFSLVLTLRADFLGKALDYQPMGEAFQKYHPVLLTPMKREELQAAIEQPAAKMKVELESGLTSKLIDDVGNQPGRLPLLEFTLSLLWSKHDKWYLTHKAYDEIGGLEKALAKYADGVLNPLSAVDKQKAERIFIQLIRPGEGTEDTKRKATRGEVGEDNWIMVEELVNHRLVVTGWDESSQKKTVEIIHEALIREWGTLREWIKRNREFRIWQERLQFAVLKWEDKNCNSGYLLSGGALAEAEAWLNNEKYQGYLSNSQREFIQKSLNKQYREEKEKVQLQKRAIKWLSSGLVAASFATGLAAWNWGKAEISATREKLNSSIVISEKSFDLQNYGDALLEALKAQQLLDNTWSGQFIKTDIKQKVKMAIHKPINHFWIEEKYTLPGHKHVVNSVVFGNDGKTIASASDDGKVKIWSASDGQLLHTLLGHKASVNGVALSNDNKTVASASKDGTIKLWSAGNGKLVYTLSGHKSEVNTVKFSPVSVATPKEFGKTIASASDDGTVKLWSADSGKLIHILSGHKSEVNSVEFSKDGQTIVSASKDGTVKLWSASNGKLIHTLSGHKSEVNSAVFSSDNKTIVSASNDETIKLWSTSDGKLINTLSGHKSEVNNAVFSNDSKTIASASKDGTVKLWSASNGKLLHTLSGHEDSVDKVEFSLDGNTIASTSKDGTVKLWSASSGKLLYSLSGLSIEFSSDGETIASVSKDNTVKLWSVEDSKLLQSLKGHKDWVRSAIFSPDGKTIASASNDKTVKLWSRTNGELFHTLSGHKDAVYNINISNNGKIIASASGDGTVKLWSVENGNLLHTLSGHGDAVYSVEFSPDGQTIVSGSADKTVKLWSASSGRLLHTLSGHEYEIFSVKFSSDGKTIASASGDGTVKLWSASSGRLLHNLSGHEIWVNSVKFSPDGKTIASASADKTVKLWSVSDGKLLHTLSGHQDAVNNVEFSPDGKTIASTSADKTVKLWSASDGRLLHTLYGHKSDVNSVRFSPVSVGTPKEFSQIIVSTSRDKTVKLWSVSDGRLLHTFSGHKSDVNSAMFSPDGKNIVSASDDRTVKLWNWDFDNLLTRGCSKLNGYLISHPDKLEEIKACQNREILTAAASTLVKQGEELAKDGNFESAVKKFRKAKNWNPKLNINPKVKAKAIALIIQGRELAQKGEIKEAIAAYNEATRIAPKQPVSVEDWNQLCWNGSLYNYPEQVMFACEKAVALAPKNEDIIDSLGFAKALSGNYQGAIEDFEMFVKWTSDTEAKSQRQAWIEDLRDGKNPFTEKVLEELR